MISSFFLLNILLSTLYEAGLMPHTSCHFQSTPLKGSSYYPDLQMQKLRLALDPFTLWLSRTSTKDKVLHLASCLCLGSCSYGIETKWFHSKEHIKLTSYYFDMVNLSDAPLPNK